MKKTRHIVTLRRWCIRRRGKGASVHDICVSVQVPRRTFYNWWNRYRQNGLEGLEPRPRRPRITHRTPPDIVEKILTLRREKAWCPILIEGYLRRQWLTEEYVSGRINEKQLLETLLIEPRNRLQSREERDYS